MKRLASLPVAAAFAGLQRASGLYWKLKSQILYKLIMGSIGARSKIIRPLQLRNTQDIYIGDDVLIHPYSWIMTLRLLDKPRPRLTIGDGCTIGHFSHITCVQEVRIGEKVLMADRVHISDNTHGYEDINSAIMDQVVASRGGVQIGDGTWLGENVSVLSCSIGKNCVIGANAVVTKNIPDFSVAVGVPARVVRQWDPSVGRWVKKIDSHC